MSAENNSAIEAYSKDQWPDAKSKDTYKFDQSFPTYGNFYGCVTQANILESRFIPL